MYDNVLIPLICDNLSTQLETMGQDIAIPQKYQPEQQGANTAPTLYIYKIGPDLLQGQPNSETVIGKGAASFTGSIQNTVLTVTGVQSGLLQPYQAVSGPSLSGAIIIAAQLSGTAGGNGTYSINQAPANGGAGSQPMTSQGASCTVQTQQYQSLFQLSCLATQDPANTNQLTASDILNLATSVMQSKVFIAAIQAQGCGIGKISQVRNPYFTDDRERYEASPSFDFTITHKQIIITGTPLVTEWGIQVYRV